MPRRTGTTLIEVLIAIFVMAIGMIALLTLFPIGALRMARAIQDDKCATAAANASAVATMMDIRNDPAVKSPPWVGGQDVFTDSLQGSGRMPADPDGPSYPVFVDPIGYSVAIPGNAQYWLAGNSPNSAGRVGRTITSFTPSGNLQAAYPWFAVLDDYVFDADENSIGTGGKPFNYGPSSFPVIRRNINYTWAYLLQRPRSSDPSIVTCSVVVYNKRPLGVQASLEVGYPATFDTTSNNITLDLGTRGAPNVRPGDWLLDCSTVQSVDANNIKRGTAHGYFYRVVGVTEIGASPNALIKYEVQQPIRGFPLPSPNPPNFGYIAVLDGVADVYDRGVDRKPN